MVHIRDWRIELIEAHPGLFHPPEGHPEAASGYPWCDEGWRDLLERLCTRMEAALRAGEIIRIAQIKEKFASLRFYWHGDVSPETRLKIDEAIALAEARSACTCEKCGDQGRLYVHGGVYMTRCAAHAEGEPVPPEPGRENVHRLHRTPGRLDIYYARYDCATDTFTEVPRPTTRSEE